MLSFVKYEIEIGVGQGFRNKGSIELRNASFLDRKTLFASLIYTYAFGLAPSGENVVGKPSKQPFDGFPYSLEFILIQLTKLIDKPFGIKKPYLREIGARFTPAYLSKV